MSVWKDWKGSLRRGRFWGLFGSSSSSDSPPLDDQLDEGYIGVQYRAHIKRILG